MKKFGKYVYGECKEIALGRPTLLGFSAGLLVGYLINRTEKLTKKTDEFQLKVQTERLVVLTELLDGVIKVTSTAQSVDKRLGIDA